MRAPQQGDPFDLDLGETAITGRYLEVDFPHRLLIEWDRHGTENATPPPALIEITLIPTGDRTNVKVQFSGLSAEDTAFYRQLWGHHLDQISAALTDTEPGALPGE